MEQTKEKPKVEDCFGKKKGCEYPESDCQLPAKKPVYETLSVEEAVQQWLAVNKYNDYNRTDLFRAGYNHAVQSKGLVSRDRVIDVLHYAMTPCNHETLAVLDECISQLNNIK